MIFLALKGDRGYHINGNWKIELPGEFDVDGTIVHYQRKGTQETFYSKGPTKEPLHIMVLYLISRISIQIIKATVDVLGALRSCSNLNLCQSTGPWAKLDVSGMKLEMCKNGILPMAIFVLILQLMFQCV